MLGDGRSPVLWVGRTLNEKIKISIEEPGALHLTKKGTSKAHPDNLCSTLQPLPRKISLEICC